MDDIEGRVKGQTLVYIYDTFFPGMAKEQAEITERLNRFEQEMSFDFIPGVLDFIADLHRNGVKTAVVTSSNEAKMAAVYRVHPEIKTLFDRILTAEMFTASKPAPDCFLLGMEVFGTTPDTTYVFEDSFNGLKAGMASGATVIGLATTAGITVAIDITTSARRSAGNMVYAWAARLGMLVGVVLGIGMYKMYGFRMVTYLSVAAGLASIFFASRVYVAFRAPIGVSLCNMDRFLLPRAWVPAINMLLIAFVPGALLPLMFVGDYWSLAALAVLVFITVPFMKMFVKLSHHCQRGTANTTCHLSMEAGLLVGMTVACHLMDKAQIYHVASVAAMLAVFFFVLLTYPYYKKKRVR